MTDDLDGELWSSHDASTEFETFTDDFGNTIREAIPPMPVKSLQRKGPMEYNSYQLDRHTGARTWANPSNDVPNEGSFDKDEVRPVDWFVSDHRRRSNVQVNTNRTGTQHEAVSENFEARDPKLYNGYNSIAPPKMRHFVPTRRSTQEASVVGAERRMGDRAAMTGERKDPLKAGMHNKISDETRGRVSRSEERAGQGTALKMGEWTGLRHLPPNDRASGQTSRSAVRGDASLSQSDSARSMIANRVTSHDHPWKQNDERANVMLSSYDSQPGKNPHPTHSDDIRRGVAPENTFIGSYDSVEAPAPQRSTFSDAARAAANLVLGHRDRSKHITRDAPSDNPVVPSRPLALDITPTNRLGPFSGQGGWHDYGEEHRRVLESVRGRDSKTDSQKVERIVSDSLERKQNLAAAQSRQLRDDPVTGRIGPERHTDAATLPHEEVRAGGSDATRLEQERPNRMEQIARPIELSNARPLSTSSTIPMFAVPRNSVDVTLPPVEPKLPRPLRDGGTVLARHEPLPGHPSTRLVLGDPRERTPRRSILGNSGRPNYSHVRSDMPNMYLSPDRGIRV